MTLVMKLSVLKFALGHIHFLTSPKVQPFADVCNQRFTMASADFSSFVVTTASYSVSTADETSLGITRFFLSIHLPHLSRMIPCSYRASACLAVLPSYETLYVISVRQTRDLPVVSLFPHPASFRFHLTMDTLAFGYILPTTGRIRDLHPLETCAARRT